MIDPKHPWFRHLWVRVLTVAAHLGWAAVEMSHGAMVWALIFGAAGAYAFWKLFVERDLP